MDQTILCPGCEALLNSSPVSAGEAGQGGRCRVGFDPARKMEEGTGPMSPLAEPSDGLDEESPLPEHRLMDPGPLPSKRRTILVLAALAASILFSGIQAFVSYSELQVLKDLGEDLRKLQVEGLASGPWGA